MNILKRKLSASLRFMFYGFLFGLCFPLLALLWFVLTENLVATQLYNLWAIAHDRHPMLYMIDTAPIFLGLFAYLAGRREDQLILLNEKLEDTVKSRTKELRLLAATFETGLATMITDANGRIVRVNQAFTKTTGYKPNEVMGQNPRFFQSGLQDRAFYANLWQTIQSEGHWHGEIWNRHKDGKNYPIWESITAVSDEDSEIEYYVAIFHDISKLKQIEASRDRLLKILETTPDFVAISKPDGSVIYMNSGSRQITGLPSTDETLRDQELKNIEGGRFGHPNWAADLVCNEGFPTAIREGIWQGESALIDKNGYEIPVSQIILAHYDEAGTVTYLSTIMRDISKQKRLEDKLQQLVTHDSLTGTYNRRHIENCLGDELYRAKRYHRSFALVMLDVDRFKKVNDSYGHEAGDNILVSLAGVINQEIRQTDILARWGGEEFMVLLPETGMDEAVWVAEKIRRTVASADFTGPGHITISLGVTNYHHGDSRDQIVKRVDDALYQAKASGRDQMVMT